MVKRPLVWVFGAYLSGLLLGWHRFPFFFVLLLIILSSIVLYLLMFAVKTRYISRRDGFLWCLPLMLLLGFGAIGQRMEPPAADLAFGEEAEGTVIGEIRQIIAKSSGSVLYLKNNRITVSGGDTYPVDHIILHASEAQSFRIGNKLHVSGRIYKFAEPSNPGQFNERMYYKIQNIDYKVIPEDIVILDAGYSRFHAVLDKVKQGILAVYKQILPEKEAGTLVAMLLGEKYLLDEELKQLYQENGISHILAISGLHISLIGVAFFHFLRKCRAGLLLSSLISILLMYCYGVLTNFSVSTNRAVVMFVVMLLARILGKTYDMLSATALSAFLILLQNPLQLFSAGFLLSFGAVLGIGLLLPCLRGLTKVKSSLLYGVFVSISAQLMTLPLILYFFYQLPVYSVLINLLILPAMSALMLSALAAGILGLISLPAGVFLVGGANYILRFYEWLCRLGSSLPANLYTTGRPGMARILLYLVLLACFLWVAGKDRRKRVLLLPVAALVLLLAPVRPSGLSVTLLDVGQGEAIFMRSPSGTTYLIDGGSSSLGHVGTYCLTPFLLSEGVDRIDYAIVSHADADHINGLGELLEGKKIEIKHLVMSGIKHSDTAGHPASDENQAFDYSAAKGTKLVSRNKKEAEEAYLELIRLATENGTDIRYLTAGDCIRDNPVSIRCLHPAEEFQWTTGNSYSLVLSINYGDFDLLLTGDLEREGERRIMRQLQASHPEDGSGNTTDYDVLKVAHHGSKTATMEDFLELIRPEYALVSCGKDNRYGHPHPELIARLEQSGCETMISYESGAVMLATDGRRLRITTYKQK